MFFAPRFWLKNGYRIDIVVIPEMFEIVIVPGRL